VSTPRQPATSALREVITGLRDELRAADLRTWFLAVGCLCLAVVWLYFGSARYFRGHFGARVAGSPWADWYPYLYYHLAAVVLLGVVPLAVMRFGFGVRPAALGLQLGDGRFGAKAVLVLVVLMTPVLYVNSFDVDFQREYPLTKLAGLSVGTWILWELTYLVYYIPWEAFFRGTLLFGLKERFGTAGALGFQTAVSCLVHVGKPFGEIFAAAPAGFLFGALALRTRSIVWPLLFHWYLGAMTDVLCYYRTH
jgi:membrane protease YdiL (CAAX protease family)